MVSRLLKTLIPGCSKRSRCEARAKSTSGGVLTDTLERGDRAQRSRWAFFNSLLDLVLAGGLGSGRLLRPRGCARRWLFLSRLSRHTRDAARRAARLGAIDGPRHRV